MQETAATRRGEIAATISREAVQVLRAFTGRGPTKARTVINTDLVAIVFSDSLTRGESRLVDLGRGDLVLDTRREYQRAMQDELVALVERATGRSVIAFLSDNHLEPDIGIEAFVLEPQDGSLLDSQDGDEGAHANGAASASRDGN